jgi:nucleotide-binding universal stress UspA family protein
MNLLLALDESGCSEAALRAVINQFRPRDTTVRVVHVIEWPRELPTSFMFAGGPAAGARVVAAHDEIRRRSCELAERAVSRLHRARFSASAHVIEGDARDEILAQAEAWPADAIVIGSHGRRRLDHLLLGSVSDGVVRRVSCSVLVVRESEADLRAEGVPAAS